MSQDADNDEMNAKEFAETAREAVKDQSRKLELWVYDLSEEENGRGLAILSANDEGGMDVYTDELEDSTLIETIPIAKIDDEGEWLKSLTQRLVEKDDDLQLEKQKSAGLSSVSKADYDDYDNIAELELNAPQKAASQVAPPEPSEPEDFEEVPEEDTPQVDDDPQPEERRILAAKLLAILKEESQVLKLVVSTVSGTYNNMSVSFDDHKGLTIEPVDTEDELKPIVIPVGEIDEGGKWLMHLRASIVKQLRLFRCLDWYANFKGGKALDGVRVATQHDAQMVEMQRASAHIKINDKFDADWAKAQRRHAEESQGTPDSTVSDASATPGIPESILGWKGSHTLADGVTKPTNVKVVNSVREKREIQTALSKQGIELGSKATDLNHCQELAGKFTFQLDAEVYKRVLNTLGVSDSRTPD